MGMGRGAMVHMVYGSVWVWVCMGRGAMVHMVYGSVNVIIIGANENVKLIQEKMSTETSKGLHTTHCE